MPFCERRAKLFEAGLWFAAMLQHILSGDRQRISIPGATYCYLQSITPDGKRKYVSAGTLDPHARKCYKEVFVAYIIEAVLDDNRLFRTLRRYSNLRQFVHTLKNQLHINIPVAFPRRTLGEVDVEVRRQALETYFRFLFKVGCSCDFIHDAIVCAGVNDFFSLVGVPPGPRGATLVDCAELPERQRRDRTSAGPHG